MGAGEEDDRKVEEGGFDTVEPEESDDSEDVMVVVINREDN